MLLEMPLKKVLLLVLFGLLRRGVLREVRFLPSWELEVVEAFRTYGAGLPDARQSALVPPEIPGCDPPLRARLSWMCWKNGETDQAIDFGGAMKKLIGSTVGKMEGFRLSDTQDYYRARVAHALAEAKAAVQPEERQSAIDRNLEWILRSQPGPDLHKGVGADTARSGPGARGGSGTARHLPRRQPPLPSPLAAGARRRRSRLYLVRVSRPQRPPARKRLPRSPDGAREKARELLLPPSRTGLTRRRKSFLAPFPAVLCGLRAPEVGSSTSAPRTEPPPISSRRSARSLAEEAVVAAAASARAPAGVRVRLRLC